MPPTGNQCRFAACWPLRPDLFTTHQRLTLRAGLSRGRLCRLWGGAAAMSACPCLSHLFSLFDDSNPGERRRSEPQRAPLWMHEPKPPNGYGVRTRALYDLAVCDSEEPEPTGILDQDGNTIFKTKNKIGFLTKAKRRRKAATQRETAKGKDLTLVGDSRGPTRGSTPVSLFKCRCSLRQRRTPHPLGPHRPVSPVSTLHKEGIQYISLLVKQPPCNLLPSAD